MIKSTTREEIKHIYSTNARWYDILLRIYRALGVNLGKWREEAIQRLPPIRKPRILDVGVGTGANLPYLIEQYPDYQEIVGIDYTPKMLAMAKKRVKDNGWTNIDLHIGDAREMTNVVKGEFDLIVSTYSLSIIPDSICVLQEMKKLLAKNGYIMLLDCQKFKGLLRIYNPIAIFLSTRLGGNDQTYSVRVSDIAASMFEPIRRKLMYSGMFYENLYRRK